MRDSTTDPDWIAPRFPHRLEVCTVAEMGIGTVAEISCTRLQHEPIEDDRNDKFGLYILFRHNVSDLVSDDRNSSNTDCRRRYGIFIELHEMLVVGRPGNVGRSVNRLVQVTKSLAMWQWAYLNTQVCGFYDLEP